MADVTVTMEAWVAVSRGLAVAAVREIEGGEEAQARTKNPGRQPRTRRVGLPKQRIGMKVGVLFAPTVPHHVPGGNSEVPPSAPPHVDSGTEARDFVPRLRLRLRLLGAPCGWGPTCCPDCCGGKKASRGDAEAGWSWD